MFCAGFTKIAIGDSQRAGLIAAGLNPDAAGVYSLMKHPKKDKKAFLKTTMGASLGGNLGMAGGAAAGMYGGLIAAHTHKFRLGGSNPSFDLPPTLLRMMRKRKPVKIPYIVAIPTVLGGLGGSIAGRYLGAKKGYEASHSDNK